MVLLEMRELASVSRSIGLAAHLRKLSKHAGQNIGIEQSEPLTDDSRLPNALHVMWSRQSGLTD